MQENFMRKFLFGLIFLFFAVQNSPIFAADFSFNKDAKKPLVLVELFTSMNCLNCPPAERALTFLQEQQPYPEAEIVTLAYHVDYLNNENWKDEFAQQIFTRRQQIYSQKFRLDSIYTPQMVVDGNFQFLGSDLRKAGNAVSEALKTPKAEIRVVTEENGFKISIENISADEDATLFLAIAESNLIPQNKRFGKSDQPISYNSVVRELKPLLKISGSQKKFQSEIFSYPILNSIKINQKIIFILQENQSRKIIALGKL